MKSGDLRRNTRGEGNSLGVLTPYDFFFARVCVLNLGLYY